MRGRVAEQLFAVNKLEASGYRSSALEQLRKIQSYEFKADKIVRIEKTEDLVFGFLYSAFYDTGPYVIFLKLIPLRPPRHH